MKGATKCGKMGWFGVVMVTQGDEKLQHSIKHTQVRVSLL